MASYWSIKKLYDIQNDYKIAKSEENTSEFNKRKESLVVRQFELLHTHNISQKTVIVLEYIQDITSKK